MRWSFMRGQEGGHLIASVITLHCVVLVACHMPALLFTAAEDVRQRRGRGRGLAPHRRGSCTRLH